METEPSHPERASTPKSIAQKQFRWFFVIQGALLIVFFLVLLNIGNYGWTLFCIIPFSLGITCGYYTKTFRSRAFLKGTLIVLIVLAVISGLLITAGMEGAICILMAEGLIALPAFLGMVVGYFIRNLYQTYSFGLILLLNTSFLAYDAVDTNIVQSTAVKTITINASREKVWNVLTQPVNFSLHKNMFFKAGVSYPTSMQLDYDEKGKCFLACNLNNGFAALEIAQLDSLERMRFLIPQEVQTMKEFTFYNSLDAPHLKGYFNPSYGEFVLQALSDTQCTLTARTSYSYKITPVFYWRWWSDYLVNTMHEHVLEDIQVLAEMP